MAAVNLHLTNFAEKGLKKLTTAVFISHFYYYEPKIAVAIIVLLLNGRIFHLYFLACACYTIARKYAECFILHVHFIPI